MRIRVGKTYHSPGIGTVLRSKVDPGNLDRLSGIYLWFIKWDRVTVSVINLRPLIWNTRMLSTGRKEWPRENTNPTYTYDSTRSSLVLPPHDTNQKTHTSLYCRHLVCEKCIYTHVYVCVLEGVHVCPKVTHPSMTTKDLSGTPWPPFSPWSPSLGETTWSFRLIGVPLETPVRLVVFISPRDDDSGHERDCYV